MYFNCHLKHIGGVMVSMLVLSAVDYWFEPRSGWMKDYKIDICCFFAKHIALRRESQDLLTGNQVQVQSV